MSISTAEAPPVIEVHGGNVVLGGRPVLRGIDLRVRPGEVVALLGGNGSGKTTLVRAVTGLVPWSHGDVALFGTPLPRFHDWQRIGYAPQRVTAAAGVPASVTEVVGSGRLARRRPFGRPSRADKEAIDAAINTMGLSRQHDVPVAQLSGGQQQRVLIARALAGEPDLFLLDEPNAGVDRQHQGQLATALRPLIESGTAVVLVLHEPGPLAELIHRLVLLRDGRVSEESPGFAAQTCAHPGHGVPVPDNVPLGGAWAAEETR